ncbi:hypothetical protein [Sphingomonas sp. 8AM]|uniref:hypothetical protein n=1 Tax=Sphingomonas sp. 8AM TaxID=2653170 RepID=UPI001F1BB5E9|nr:hypothetical protein [Sphingomonas sp. 8AM]
MIDFIVCCAALDACSAPTLIWSDALRSSSAADDASAIPLDNCVVADAMRSAAFCCRAKVRALRFSASAVTRTAREVVMISAACSLCALPTAVRLASAMVCFPSRHLEYADWMSPTSLAESLIVILLSWIVQKEQPFSGGSKM